MLSFFSYLLVLKKLSNFENCTVTPQNLPDSVEDMKDPNLFQLRSATVPGENRVVSLGERWWGVPGFSVHQRGVSVRRQAIIWAQ